MPGWFAERLAGVQMFRPTLLANREVKANARPGREEVRDSNVIYLIFTDHCEVLCRVESTFELLSRLL